MFLLLFILLFSSITTPVLAQGLSSPESCALSPESKRQLNLIESFAKEGTPLYVPVRSHLPLRWRSTQDYAAEVFSDSLSSILIRSTAELRFLPNTLSYSRILLITENDQVLNKRRLADLIDISQFKNLTVSVIWLGSEESKHLRKLAKVTGGTYHSSLSVIKKACKRRLLREFSAQSF